jgi:hypothetical protein
MVEVTSREESFAFRFMRLSASSVEKLQNLLSTVKLTVRKRDEGSVVSFDITETTDLRPLYEFLSEEDIHSSEYSVWISVVTSSDHSSVSLPGYMLELIRRTKGGVDFSFMVCL